MRGADSGSSEGVGLDHFEVINVKGKKITEAFFEGGRKEEEKGQIILKVLWFVKEKLTGSVGDRGEDSSLIV